MNSFLFILQLTFRSLIISYFQSNLILILIHSTIPYWSSVEIQNKNYNSCWNTTGNVNGICRWPEHHLLQCRPFQMCKLHSFNLVFTFFLWPFSQVKYMYLISCMQGMSVSNAPPSFRSGQNPSKMNKQKWENSEWRSENEGIQWVANKTVAADASVWSANNGRLHRIRR